MVLYTVGIDVGGTNIKLGLVSPSGKIIARSNLITKDHAEHPKQLIDSLIDTIKALIKDNGKTIKDIAGIGIGIPGLVNIAKGIVMVITNIPGWKNIPLRAIIQKKIKLPVFIDNDVNLVALGEWKLGAGLGYNNLVCITLGTGVGGGLILNGALYRGEGFVAGEVGHIPLNEDGPKCNCGGIGCFERYVGNQTLLANIANIYKRKLRIQDLFPLASKGEPRAVKFWRDNAVYIGHALVGVINLLNPRLIIIGGGVAHNYKFMGKTIRDVINRRAMSIPKKMVKVVRARLGDDAGILGAYILVKESIVER